MRTWTGQLSPLPSNGQAGRVDPFDIVMLLGRKRRFGDNGDLEFSVLHHSVLVAMIWTIAGFPQDKMVYALIHDFHESYTGDIPSPIKHITPEFYKTIRGLEKMLDDRIYDFLGIESPDKETKTMVKLCDQASLVMEAMIIGPPGSDDLLNLRKEVPDQQVWDIVEKVMPHLEYVSKSARQKTPNKRHAAYGNG